MTVMMTDAQVNTIGLIVVAIIGAISSTLAAYWARTAKQNSAAAKENSAGALNEVRTNGGMSDPNPNLNDHVKYQTEMMEELKTEMTSLREEFTEHLAHSRVMDQAVAELYFVVKPQMPGDASPT